MIRHLTELHIACGSSHCKCRLRDNAVVRMRPGHSGWRCRDLTLHPGGTPFALAGETVVPGIAAGDADGIFEEHSVVASLRAAPPRPPFYARSERIFCFGPVLASISVGGKAAGGGGSADGECGAVAGLKLSNPFKVLSWRAMRVSANKLRNCLICTSFGIHHLWERSSTVSS